MPGPAAKRRPGRTLFDDLVAEFLGMFIIIILGDGSVALSLVGLPGSGRQTADFGPANWLIIIWGWGLAVTFAVYTTGGVSGAHLNPAVTLGFALRRAFAWAKVIPFWFAQVVGGFAGGALVYAVYHHAIDAFNHANHLPHRPDSVPSFSIFATFPAQYFHGGSWGPLLDQIVGTAILVGLIFALTDNRNSAPTGNLAPFMIGLVVVVIGVTYGVNAGYAINPARDLGPRTFAWLAGWGHAAFPGKGAWFDNYWWIPILGPLIGGAVGALVYDGLIGSVLTRRTGRGPNAEAPPEPVAETE